ncbi:hypothetical protein QFC19_006484 [Naganishia cerealis]|uniref:Uncharacterized protein n=1 Tax=Naganishia cerealis TaxID=610337 RepID=A0ACC2VF59_9TREE|nr:hypothetical protein QFC19_006484 [Naganishia cerealis]
MLSIEQGLKPQVFHQHQDLLLSTVQQDFSSVIDRLKASAGDSATPLNSVHLATTTEIPAASGLFLGVTDTSTASLPSDLLTIQLTRKTPEELPDPAVASANHLFFRIPRSKKGEMQFVTCVLPACIDAATKVFQTNAPRIAVVDDDGKDVSVGVMIALSWILLDNDGTVRHGSAPTGELLHSEDAHARACVPPRTDTWILPAATKTDTRTRLQWILDKRPGANPSRSTLQRVNEFLMSPRRVA